MTDILEDYCDRFLKGLGSLQTKVVAEKCGRKSTSKKNVETTDSPTATLNGQVAPEKRSEPPGKGKKLQSDHEKGSDPTAKTGPAKATPRPKLEMKRQFFVNELRVTIRECMVKNKDGVRGEAIEEFADSELALHLEEEAHVTPAATAGRRHAKSDT